MTSQKNRILIGRDLLIPAAQKSLQQITCLIMPSTSSCVHSGQNNNKVTQISDTSNIGCHGEPCTPLTRKKDAFNWASTPNSERLELPFFKLPIKIRSWSVEGETRIFLPWNYHQQTRKSSLDAIGNSRYASSKSIWWRHTKVPFFSFWAFAAASLEVKRTKAYP